MVMSQNSLGRTSGAHKLVPNDSTVQQVLPIHRLASRHIMAPWRLGQEFSKLVKSPKLKFWMSPLESDFLDRNQKYGRGMSFIY